MTQRPAQIEMEFHRDWCPRHLAPLRAKWPKGAGLAMLGLMNAVLRDERIQQMCRAGETGDTARINDVLEEIAPACCFLGDEVASAVITMALAGAVYGQEAKA